MSSPVLQTAEQSYNASITSYISMCNNITNSENELIALEMNFKMESSDIQNELNTNKQLLNIQHRDVIASKNAYKCALESFIKYAYDTSFLGDCVDMLCERQECESDDTVTIFSSCSSDTSCKKLNTHHTHKHVHEHKREDKHKRNIKPQGTIKSAAKTSCKTCK